MTLSSQPGLRIHGRLANSQANGPGKRAVIWFQGCTLGCPGCYNPQTHTGAGGDWVTAEALVDWILQLGPELSGVSISGGEPFEQSRGLRSLVEEIRSRTPDLSILIFSGFSLDEIRRFTDGPTILAAIDVLIDGRYNQKLHQGRSLLGSTNQNIHCLTSRYTAEEIAATPATEVSIDPEGRIVLTGVSPLDMESIER